MGKRSNVIKRSTDAYLNGTSNEDTKMYLVNDDDCKVCGIKKVDGMKLLRCGNCELTYYCSKACQKMDWPAHKNGCKEYMRKKEIANQSVMSVSQVVKDGKYIVLNQQGRIEEGPTLTDEPINPSFLVDNKLVPVTILKVSLTSKHTTEPIIMDVMMTTGSLSSTISVSLANKLGLTQSEKIYYTGCMKMDQSGFIPSDAIQVECLVGDFTTPGVTGIPSIDNNPQNVMIAPVIVPSISGDILNIGRDWLYRFGSQNNGEFKLRFGPSYGQLIMHMSNANPPDIGNTVLFDWGYIAGKPRADMSHLCSPDAVAMETLNQLVENII